MNPNTRSFRLRLITFVTLAIVGAHQSSLANVILTPKYDVSRVNRNTGNFGPPYVTDNQIVQVINFAWESDVYLQFDLSNVRGLENATGMTLRLYEIQSGFSDDRNSSLTDVIDLYATGDAWTPATSYGAMPLRQGGLLDRLTQAPRTFGWAEWTIAPSEIAGEMGDGTLSLVLENTQQTSGPWNMATFRSMSADDTQFAPQLVIAGAVTLVPEPATGAIALAAGAALFACSHGRRR